MRLYGKDHELRLISRRIDTQSERNTTVIDLNILFTANLAILNFQLMRSNHHLLDSKAIRGIGLALLLSVKIDIGISHITIHNNAVGLVKARLKLILFASLKVKLHLVRCSKSWVL